MPPIVFESTEMTFETYPPQVAADATLKIGEAHTYTGHFGTHNDKKMRMQLMVKAYTELNQPIK
jgi:hypothetical protein